MQITLKDVMPREFEIEHFQSRAYKRFADAKVIRQFNFFGGPRRRWPGPQRNVHNWVIVEGGYAVGMNENPGRGWSFPVYKMKGEY